jgi:hypothetical protein
MVGLWNGSAYLQETDQVVEFGKGVLTSRIRIKWWTGRGSAYLQDPDQVVELGNGVLTFRIRIFKWWNWERSSYLQDPDGTGYNGSAHFKDSD